MYVCICISSIKEIVCYCNRIECYCIIHVKLRGSREANKPCMQPS